MAAFSLFMLSLLFLAQDWDLASQEALDPPKLF